MANRWDITDVAGVIDQPLPGGLVELWNAVPQGAATSTAALAAARASSQIAIAQGLTLVQQQVIAAAGASVGLRPEIFDKIRGLPGVDVLAETALLALQGNFSLANLTNAAKELLIDIVAKVGGKIGGQAAIVGYIDAVAQAVAVVWWAVETIVESERAWAAYQEAQAQAALECNQLAYSAGLDQAQTTYAIQDILLSQDWRDLFLPEVRPFDPGYGEKSQNWGPDASFPPGGPLDVGWLGFTCCPTPTGGRMIAPVGAGVGNRIQRDWRPVFYGDGPGFGCLPMCSQLPIHRAIIVPGGPPIYDPAQSLPQLAGVGQQAWRILWGRGPAAFALDGDMLADAWSEYFRGMRLFIAGNTIGIGGQPLYDSRVCDTWDATGRRRALNWLYSRIGVPAENADLDGVVNWEDAIPVKAWRKFSEYQSSLLERLVVAYVDARTCAPEWRARVDQAQRDLLGSDAVCDLDIESIPDLDYRAAIVAARKTKGAQCYTVSSRLAAYGHVSATEGPSTAPIGGQASPIPEFPEYTTMAKFVGRGGGAPVAAIATAGAAGLGLLALLRSLR